MNQRNVLLITAGLLLLASVPAMAGDTKGSDITVTGEVITAIADERTGQVYELFPGENQTLPENIKPGANITVTGTRTTRKGHTAIQIEKIGA